MGPTKSTTVRRLWLALAAATALTTLPACTTSSDEPDGTDRTARRAAASHAASVAALRTAERSTDGADSVRVESATTLGSMMSMTADGTLAWGDGLTGTLTITYTGGTLADTVRRLGSASMEARYLPDAYYARMGDRFAARAGGRHWIRYGYEDLKDLAGGSAAHLADHMRSTTPHQSVKLLLASGDVRKVGEERIRGRRTTHYAGTVDVAGLAPRDSGLSESRLAELKEQLTRAGVTIQTVDLWVDDRDLLVKKVERADTATGRLTQTAHYDDYGVGVSTQAPPAGDTQDFTELVDGQLS
ncbi:hypothetical protein ACFYOV_12005 [Streptomyces sp. NPDC005931]|uniref:hypothetical protein n=1 Tax=Streptomyces sp. NPDC005931 TaxID=3364737 RepID=UPI0036910986